MLDLDSGVFTCFTPGYYQVSFSALVYGGPSYAGNQNLCLYKNGSKLSESWWHLYGGYLKDNIGLTGSRILVSNLLENVCVKVAKM